MNKKLLELLNSINEQKKLVQSLAEEGKLDDAAKEKEKLEGMQKKFDLLKDVLDQEPQDKFRDVLGQNPQDAGGQVASCRPGSKDASGPAGVTLVKPAGEDAPKDAVTLFAEAARNGFKNTMSEGTPADGGYTVPEDIQTMINEYRDTKASLIDEVDVEVVSTLSGARTFKKRSQQTGFTKVGEGGKIPGKNTPQFERLEYEIAKYAGYFPITNELLEDTDANITGVLVSWIGDESRVTRNKLILAVADQKEKTALSGLDDIKKALNVTLGQAFKGTSKITTNDDGLQYLDTLKDANGRDLLQPNPTEAAKLQLRAGATVVPVKAVPNSDFPSDTATAGKRKIPFIIGDLKEAIKFFDRKHLTIMVSNTAAIGELNAFEEDLTLYRAIEREDVQMKDPDAIVYGILTVDDPENTAGTAGGGSGSAGSGGDAGGESGK